MPRPGRVAHPVYRLVYARFLLDIGVEAVHLSGLADSLAGSSAWVRRATSGQHQAAARLGALFVDLPYFDRFARAVIRYALKKPQAHSVSGDVFHQKTPIALGRLFGEAGVRLAAKTATRQAGETLTALALMPSSLQERKAK